MSKNVTVHRRKRSEWTGIFGVASHFLLRDKFQLTERLISLWKILSVFMLFSLNKRILPEVIFFLLCLDPEK